MTRSLDKVRSGGQRAQPVIDRRRDQLETAAFVSATVIGCQGVAPPPSETCHKAKQRRCGHSAAERQLKGDRRQTRGIFDWKAQSNLFHNALK